MLQRALVLAGLPLALPLSLFLACTGDISTTTADGVPVPGQGASGGTVKAGSGGAGATATIGEPSPSAGQGGAGNVVSPPSIPAPACSPAVRRVWRLTPNQYVRTMAAVLNTTVNGLSDLEGTLPAFQGFSNDAGPEVLSVPHVSQLFSLTRKVVATAFADPGKMFACLADKLGDAACVRAFIDNFGTRAFRRPLTTAEVDGYLMLFQKNAPTQTNAVALRSLVVAMLMSPNFLFRTELGASPPAANMKTVTLTPYEKASSLSYFLTDGPPDADLMNAARSGGLDTADKVSTQARRLLANAELASGAFKYFMEKFGIGEVLTATKETRDFPMWSQSLAADMARASELFLQDVLWQGGARFSALFTANHAHASSQMKFLYDFAQAMPVASTFQKISLPPTHAGGLMVHPSLMANMVVDSDTGPVKRGLFIREKVLCQEVPDPDLATAAMATQAKPDGRTTQRERLAVHAQKAFCANCHKLMDPIGLAFENFDAIGRYRLTEAKKTIDASGTLTGATPENARFSNAVDLLKMLAASPEAAECFAKSALNYASGRSVTEVDSCQIERVTKRFKDSGGNMLELLVVIASDEQFFVRRTEL